MMTVTVETLTLTAYEKARIKFRDEFSKGIKPVDSRQPIPDFLAKAMVVELVAKNVPKDALIGIFDAFLILATHLKEAGFTNLVLLENEHKNLSLSNEKYYNNVKNLCEKSGIKYYVPPMNNYNRCTMKFDVIIGNPPYQSDNGGGSYRGSTTNPLWWQITKISFNLLKENGILSFITPTNIINGGDSFTKVFLGKERKYDLIKVDFKAADSFNVGIPICRWVVKNSKTNSHQISVTDGRILDADNTIKISKDKIINDILSIVFNHKGEKLNFNTNNRYDFQNVEKHLKKNDLPLEWAKDLKLSQDEVYQYPVNVNGKIKYSKIKWKNNGIWRVFYPQMQHPTQIMVDNVAEAAPSTFTMIVSSKEEGEKIKSILDNPIYQWVIDQTRVSGRVTNIISKFPNAPIEEVLTSEQLSYIQSQL